MAQRLPQHKATMLSDFGIRLRRITSSPIEDAPVSYIHQDDYYVIGLVEAGTGCGLIDFKECRFSEGDLFLIQPGQAHRFVNSKDTAGWILFIDSSFFGYLEKSTFDKFALFASSVKIDNQRMSDLKQIASILSSKMDHITNELAKATARRLAETFVSMVAEALQEFGLQRVAHSRRQLEIVSSLRRLLDEHLTTNRSQSYYASQLHISPVYLNEVVKEVTGINASLYIKNEVVLRAKRLLVHTDLAVKEISDRLGIDDSAYFSRLFTGATGISPSLFRQRNLK